MVVTSKPANGTAILFRPEKIGTRVWRIRLSGFQGGEYGFLPPGVAASSIAASGKIYAFGITGEYQDQSSLADRTDSHDQQRQTTDELPATKNISEVKKVVISGAMRPGVLGVSGANWMEGGVTGVEIMDVAPGSPAEIAGLHVRDVITDINGSKIHSTEDLAGVLAQNEPGSKIRLATF